MLDHVVGYHERADVRWHAVESTAVDDLDSVCLGLIAIPSMHFAYPGKLACGETVLKNLHVHAAPQMAALAYLKISAMLVPCEPHR